MVEIEENQCRNKENRKYFYAKISEFLENDVVIRNHLKSEFSLLRKDFNSEKTNYILSICKKINESFKKGIYFEKTLDLTKQLLLEDSEPNIQFVNQINYYSQVLIVELIRKSYDLEDVKTFLKNIFDEYRYQGDSLITYFPHNINHSKFKNKEGEIDFTKADLKVKSIIDALSISDRINKLSYYYDKKPQKVKYIFFINGIKGDIEKTACDVTFYSLSRKRFITDDRVLDSEDLQRHFKEDKYIQAAVEVEYLLPISSLKFAKSKVENALDILSCFFHQRTEISLNESNYIIVDSQSRMIYSSSGRGKEDRFMNFYDSLNLNEIENHLEDLEEYSFLWRPLDSNETVSKIKISFH